MYTSQEREVACQQREVTAALGASEHAAVACFAVTAAYACGCRAALDRARLTATQQASHVATLQLEVAHRDVRLVQALEDAAAQKEQNCIVSEREMSAAAEHAVQVSNVRCQILVACMSEAAPSGLVCARQVADLESRLQGDKAAANAAEGEHSRLVAIFTEKLLTEQAEAAARQASAVAAVEKRHRAGVADMQRTHDAALSAAAAEVAAAEAASEAVLVAALASVQVPRLWIGPCPTCAHQPGRTHPTVLHYYSRRTADEHNGSHTHRREVLCARRTPWLMAGRHRGAAGDACRRAGVGPCQRPRGGGGRSAAGHAAGSRAGGLRCRGSAQQMRSGRAAESGPGGARWGGGSPWSSAGCLRVRSFILIRTAYM